MYWIYLVLFLLIIYIKNKYCSLYLFKLQKAKAETIKQIVIVLVITAISMFSRYYKISKAKIVM